MQELNKSQIANHNVIEQNFKKDVENIKSLENNGDNSKSSSKID